MKRRTLKKRAMRLVREQERDWKRVRGRHDRQRWLVGAIQVVHWTDVKFIVDGHPFPGVGGVDWATQAASASKLTMQDLFDAAATLRRHNVPTVDGHYTAFVHPSRVGEVVSGRQWAKAGRSKAAAAGPGAQARLPSVAVVGAGLPDVPRHTRTAKAHGHRGRAWGQGAVSHGRANWRVSYARKALVGKG